MKKALVLRGFYSKEDYIKSFIVKWEPLAYSLNFDNLIDLYRENLFPFYDDIYFATYSDTPEKDKRLIEELNPKSYLFLDPNYYTQIDTFNRALDLVEDEYDEVCVTRFDLVWKMPFSNINYDSSKTNFIWRETEPHWTNRRFTGDALHIFNGKQFETIRSLSKTYQFHEDNSLHGLYAHLESQMGSEDFRFIFDDQHYNSDPTHPSNPEVIPNPLYYIWRGSFRDDV